MKRASYREAVAWVAINDSGGSEDAHNPEVVSELITALLVADIFRVEPINVGKAIVRYRKKERAEERKRAKQELRGEPKAPA